MITKEKEELLKYYNMGLAAYKQRRWDDAIHAFEKALAIEPEDGPSVEYLKRSRVFQGDASTSELGRRFYDDDKITHGGQEHG